MKLLLECININKSFRNKRVLNNVSLSLYEGDILGFIGPNGAGRTTTIKLILGLQTIDKGTIIINSFDIKDNFERAIEKVGAIVENPDNYMYLSGYDNLLLIKNVYKNITKDDIWNVVKLVGLENRIDDKVSKYSLGMRQRLGIAKALITRPNILILDEPTNGLDPKGIKELRDLLKKLAKEGMGILISSHSLSELESFCNKITIINNGKIIETSDVLNIKNSDDTYQFNVSKIPSIKNIKMVNNKNFLIKLKKDEINDIITKLLEENIKIYGINKVELTLEEAYLKKTGGTKIV